MNAIHKQKLPVFETLGDVITLQLQPFAKILKIARQYQHDPSPYVWYICNPALQATEQYRILMVGTGHEFPADVASGYLGTEIFHDGQLVLHFFLLDDERYEA